MESQTFSSPTGAARAQDGEVWGPTRGSTRAPLGATLSLTASLAVGTLLFAIGFVFALAHPEPYIARFLPLGIAEQNQSAKTAVYVLALVVLLPLCVLVVPRVSDRIADGDAADTLPGLAVLLPAGLGAAVVFARLSGALPWGDGLWVLTATVGLWLIAAVAGLAAAASGASLRVLRFAGAHREPVGAAAVVLVTAGLLIGTKSPSLHAVPLALGACVVGAVLVGWVREPSRAAARAWLDRLRPRSPAFGRWAPRSLDLLVGVLLILAIVPGVVVQTSVGPPNLFVPPGIVQYHQDFLLGPANQLLRGGGALMVNVPISQYGVGPIYLLYVFFHVVPIGYGTYGLLDGLLTALFYLGGYLVLRFAGVRRPLALCALGVAVVVFIYDLLYPVGELPQQGPLRFGLPMAVVGGLVLATRRPERATAGRALAFTALALSAVWAVETFAYTAATFAVMIGVEALLSPGHRRGRWLARQAGIAVAACAAAHLVLAGWTLAVTGHLPNWGEYVTYIREFLAGHTSEDTYGFERWSPVLAVAMGTLVMVIALVLVLWRARRFAVRERTIMVALAGLTTDAVALLSYSDNRASTYLVAYVALPLLMVVTLWLHLLLHRSSTRPAVRTGGLAMASTIAAVLVAVAWPSVGGRFSRSLLAHAYPGGGLRAAFHQVLHAPPVDPRAPDGERLVNEYLPGRRVLILIPLYPDLATEILIRDGRANFFFSGDPKADSYVPSVWTGKVERQIAGLRSGTRVLVDRSALLFLAESRLQPGRDVVANPIGLGDPEVEWILQHLQRRFNFVPVHTGPDGFVVEQLVAR